MPLILSFDKPKLKQIIKSPDLPDLRIVRLRSKPTINLRNISSPEIPSLLKLDIPSSEIPDVVEPTVDKISSPVIHKITRTQISSFESVRQIRHSIARKFSVDRKAVITRVIMNVQLAKKERTHQLIIKFLILYENLITYKLKKNFKKNFESLIKA
jgi:hypothetical protein